MNNKRNIIISYLFPVLLVLLPGITFANRNGAHDNWGRALEVLFMMVVALIIVSIINFIAFVSNISRKSKGRAKLVIVLSLLILSTCVWWLYVLITRDLNKGALNAMLCGIIVAQLGAIMHSVQIIKSPKANDTHE